MTGRHVKPIGAILFQPGWDINKTEPVLSAFCQSNHAKIDEEVDYSNERKYINSRSGLTLIFGMMASNGIGRQILTKACICTKA